MVRYYQTIRWQIADELFECVWPFRGIGTFRVECRVLRYCDVFFNTGKY